MGAKQSLSDEDIQGKVTAYYELKRKKAEVDSKFKASQEKFYALMDEFFGAKGISDKFSFDNGKKHYGASRVVNRKVSFDASKVRDRIGKELSSDVIVKVIKVNDIDGLVKYLKAFGVDPKVFKSFLDVTYEVDVKELDQKVDLGFISMDDLDGCYSVKESKPYFKVTMVEDDDEQ